MLAGEAASERGAAVNTEKTAYNHAEKYGLNRSAKQKTPSSLGDL
jgi:hypothetical protein